MTDIWLWLQWLFFMPGDALIARIGPTPLGALLDLTPKSFGTTPSAVLSGALWLIGLWTVHAVWAFLIDAAGPTYRADRLERRRAEAAARRAFLQRQRAIYRGRFVRRFGAWVVSGLVVVLLAVLGLAVVKEVL
ncbi:MAG: hypothetical protein A3G81_14710 [Betaproteobacteria bacterium RIFCSPLOWO2_12_FULL_65_14]|nr:MAG: hypothetical protein A3G81_14710 [Betaproteobacteria bacterium RIFCSPLOWO2_12_FULL_65_14]